MSVACSYCGWSLGEHSANCVELAGRCPWCLAYQGDRHSVHCPMTGTNPFEDTDAYHDTPVRRHQPLSTTAEYLRQKDDLMRYEAEIMRKKDREKMKTSAKRIGDSERAETTEHLASCFSTGHITQEEFYERSDRAAKAAWQVQLDEIVRDLPDVPQQPVAKKRKVLTQVLQSPDQSMPAIPFSMTKMVTTVFLFFIPFIMSLAWAHAAHGLGHVPGNGAAAIFMGGASLIGTALSGILFGPGKTVEIEE